MRAIATSNVNPQGPWWFWPALGVLGVLGVGTAVYAWRRARRAPPLADAEEVSAASWGDNPYGFGWASQDESAGLSQRTEGGLPLSDQMILDADCSGPAVRVVKWRYDIRLTNYFWHLWRQGERDPVLLTMGILELDSPHCSWPPDVDAPRWQDVIWEGTLAAVTNYVNLVESGEIYELAWDPLDPREDMSVKPLVAWA